MNTFSNWGHPRLLPAHPLKRRLAVAAGGLLCRLRPGVAAQLRRGEKPLSTALQDRLMAAFLIDSRLRRGCLEELSHFHQQFWASDDALAAHAAIEQHFDSWRARTEGLMGALEQKGACGRYGTLCEIGCGNGRMLDHLAGRVGGIGRFIGVDLSETQTALNRRRYPNPKLEFVCAEALGWIGRHAEPGWLYFSTGGVLEYWPQVQVEALLNLMATKLKPAALAISEPLGPSHDLTTGSSSQPFGRELTFSHNYPALAVRAGFRIDYRREVNSGAGRFLCLMASMAPGSAQG